MVRRPFWRDEGGQSLIVVAGAFALLLGAVAFSVDQGYALAQRRFMSNASQAGALAAGKMLAKSVVATDQGTIFGATEEDLYGRACDYVQDNLGSPVARSTYSATMQFITLDGTVTGTISRSFTSSFCNTPTTATTVDPDVRDVRVTITVSYPTLFASIIGSPDLDVSGIARVRVAGVPFSGGTGATWPIVRHYNPTDFESDCDPPCNPSNADPFTFWGNESWGEFKSVIAMTRESGRSSGVMQMLEAWDQTGSPEADPPTSKKTAVGSFQQCTGSLFDTRGYSRAESGGSENTWKDAQHKCDTYEWLYYGFGGSVSLSRDWSTPPAGGEAPAPTGLGSRAFACTDVPTYMNTPSCDDDGIGDWVETVFGNWGSNVQDQLKAAIQDFGATNEWSELETKNGTPYGKALTVNVFLWDCAEEFDSGQPAGSQWTLVQNTINPDCSDPAQIPQSADVSRVHVFTVVPFTFYEGLVSASKIEGYWGGAFGDSDAGFTSCQSGCDLNPFSNTAFLVADQ